MPDKEQEKAYATPEDLDPVDAPGARFVRETADSDTTVTDANGVERKIVKGEPIPVDLVEEVRSGGSKSKSK